MSALISLTAKQLFLLVCAVPTVLFISRLLYNLFLHPLAKYPGPWYCRASRLPYVYWQVTGWLPQTIKKIHEQYGPIVRIAPNDICFTQSQAWFDIHGHRTTPNKKRYERDPSVYPDLPGRAPSILFSNESDHSRYRRLLSHAFSAQALRDQEPILRSHVELLVQRLGEEIDASSGKVDMTTWLNRMTFDVIGDLAFGESFGCVQDKRSHPWVDTMFSALKDIVYLAALSHLPSFIYHRILKLLAIFMLEGIQESQIYSTEKVTKRIAQGTTRNDFMSPVLRANDEKGMTFEEMEASFAVIITAGSETGAVTVSNALYHLTQNPEAMSAIVKELTSTFKSPSQADVQSLEHLPYLHGVMEEALRIHSPTAFNQARVISDGGAQICGEQLPAGVSVSVATYAATLSKDNWTDPKAFRPERWIGEGLPGDDRRSMQAFSLGARGCLGKNLAYAEVKLILAHLLLNFEWSLCEESRNWEDGQRFYLVWQRPPLYFKISHRSW